MLKSLVQITAKSSSSVVVHIYDLQLIFKLIEATYALKLTLWPLWIYLDTGITNKSLSQFISQNINSSSFNSPVLLIRRKKHSWDESLMYTKTLFQLIDLVNENINQVNQQEHQPQQQVTTLRQTTNLDKEDETVSCDNLSNSNYKKNSLLFKR